VTVIIRAASTDDEDLAAVERVINAASPEDGTSLEDLRWSDRAYPGIVRFLAELDGRPVGAATVGRIFVHPPEFEALWATVDVLPGARRIGIGGALLAATARTAEAAGKTHLHVPAVADRAEAIAFLERRGFVEHERMRSVRLDLAAISRPQDDPPNGIELTDLAARPDLVAGVHAVAVEAFQDIPGGDGPIAPGDLAEFRARDVDRPGFPPDAFVVALEQSSGRVVGYAALQLKPGSPTIAWHDMTAVVRAWRRRGLATALKRRTIAWALDHELVALETGSDEANLGMQAVNARLGYRPLPDLLTMRGPLGRAKMTR
jgi:GNAT superfamily N-acetyltransferase